MRTKLIAMVCAALTCVGPVNAEDLNQIFSRVNEFVAKKNYPKALEELQWAKKEIEKLNNSSLTGFLPDEVAGYTGSKAEINSAMGFMNIERTYTKGEASIKLAIQGTSGGGAGGMGGLAALGKMAAMFGGEEGQETIRIQGRTSTVKEDEITIFMDSGAVIQIRNAGAAPASDLKAIADALKLNDIDTYMRGQ